MSIQSTSFNALTTQRSFANPTIDSGILAGGVFDGRGNDFLDPDDILGNVDDFAQGITPVDSGNPMVLLLGPNPIDQNANSFDVLSDTNGTLNNIFSPNFGASLLTPSSALNRDLANFNPLIWENPSSVNVLVGTMDATNKIFGGNGLFRPNLVPPLFPAITQPQPPFNQFVTPTLSQAQLFSTTFLTGSPLFQPVGIPVSGTQTGLTILRLQAQIQLLQKEIVDLEALRQQTSRLDQTGAEDKARVQNRLTQLQTQIDQKKLQLRNTQQALLQLQAQNGQTGVVVPSLPGGFFPGSGFNSQPFAISGSAVIFPFQSQVALMGQLFGQHNALPDTGFSRSGNIVSRQVNGLTINQLAPANGVPAWIG